METGEIVSLLNSKEICSLAINTESLDSNNFQIALIDLSLVEYSVVTITQIGEGRP